jgi:hypothetical protein
LKTRTKTGDPGCMPFFARSDSVSFDSGTSDGGGMVGVFEQAAIMTTTAKRAVWTAAFHVNATRISTNAIFPELFPVPQVGEL